jgi:hypothetical protein
MPWDGSCTSDQQWLCPPDDEFDPEWDMGGPGETGDLRDVGRLEPEDHELFSTSRFGPRVSFSRRLLSLMRFMHNTPDVGFQSMRSMLGLLGRQWETVRVWGGFARAKKANEVNSEVNTATDYPAPIIGSVWKASAPVGISAKPIRVAT